MVLIAKLEVDTVSVPMSVTYGSPDHDWMPQISSRVVYAVVMVIDR